MRSAERTAIQSSSFHEENHAAGTEGWGDSIVGFGTYHYKYASGREGDWFVTGFSPRKQNLTIYLMRFGRP